MKALFFIDPKHRVSFCAALLAAGLISASPFVYAQSASKPDRDQSLESHQPNELAEALQAEFAVQDGKSEEAAKLYLSAAQKSKRLDYAENATRYAFNARNFILAESAAQLWRSLAKDSLSAHQAVAFALIAQGKKPEALKEIRALMVKEKGSELAIELMSAPDAQSLAVELLPDLQKVPEIIALGPERGLIPLALRLKQNSVALSLAQAKSQSDAKNSKAWLWLGLSQIANKLNNEAAASYQKALDLDPNNNRLRLSLVQILNDLQRTAEIEQVLRAAPKQDQTIFQARLAYFTAGKNKKGIKKLMREIEKSNELDLADKQMLMGSAAELLDKTKLALQWYQDIGKGEHWPQAQLRIAILLAKTDLPAARTVLQELQTSVAAEQSIIDGYLLESELLNKAKPDPKVAANLPQEAIAVLSKGIRKYPESTDLRYARAMAALALKDIKTMESDLQLITQLDPENAQAWNSLGYSLLVETDRLDEAYGYIQQAYALDPKSGAIQDSLGWAMFKRGRLDQAVPMLRTAYKTEPEGEIAAHLGEALWVLGAKEEAIAVFVEGREKFPDSQPLQETIKRLGVELPKATKQPNKKN